MSARVPALGERNQQPAAIVLAPGERVQIGARVDAGAGTARADGRDVGVEADGELAHDGRLVQSMDAVQPGERGAGVVGAREQQLAQLDEPAPAEPAEVEHAGERVERL